MKKTLWLLLLTPLQLMGTLLVLYAALCGLCLLFGADSLFGTYLTGGSFAFSLVAALCAAQATAAYCPLALSLGATRRALRGGVAAAWAALALLAHGATLLVNWLAFALFPPERASRAWLYGFSRHPLPGLGVALLLAGASLWVGTLQTQGRTTARNVLLVLFEILLFAQVFVFLLLSQLAPVLPAAALPLYGGALAALGLVFLLLALRRLKTLAVSQG